MTKPSTFMSWQSWVVGGVFTLLTAVGAYAFNAIDSRMAASETRIIALEQSSVTKREKIAALEAKEGDIEKTLLDIKSSIDTLIKMHLKDRTTDEVNFQFLNRKK
jgi:hypothetical protein